ncbi:FtsW/RodA/SpoVE family cell cycle protein [Mollicutes bacterium LVI A0039]|nr:FtsW/RodA/SpoVE family cell cycle protein [Mollicutes bacterium LVI A0039]
MKKHHVIVLLWLIVSVYGAAMAFSATYVNVTINGGNAFKELASQIIIIIILGIMGTYVFMVSKKINTYQLMKRFSKMLMYISLVSLALVLVIGSDSVRGGARMVIPLGPVDFQPLELYKIALLLYFAKIFSSVKPTETIVDSIKKLAIPGIGIILLMVQPDFGGAMICLLVIFFLLLVNGQNIKELMMASGGVAVLGLLGFSLLQDYQKSRIYVWLDPFIDVQGSGYQLINSYVAISNGGLFGSGFMSGIQKAGYLTQPGSDFIFATICEELGLFGAAFTIAILVAISLVAISIGNTAHERFGMLYCYGFGILLLTQTFINIGGVSGVIPMTGVTLPFISTGINSYLFLTLGVFLTIPVSRVSIKEKKRERKAANLKG